MDAMHFEGKHQMRVKHARQVELLTQDYEARIAAVQEERDHELTVSDETFQRGILRDLCDFLIRHYNPAKYPPGLQTLVDALTGRFDPVTGEVQNGPHVVEGTIVPTSYHQLAAFRDTIVEGIHAIAAANADFRTIVRVELDDHIDYLDAKLQVADNEIKAHRAHVRKLEHKVQQQERHLAKLAMTYANAREVYRVEDLLEELNEFRCPSNVIMSLRRNGAFRDLWSDMARPRARTSSAQSSRAEVDDETVEGDE